MRGDIWTTLKCAIVIVLVLSVIVAAWVIGGEE